MAQASDGSVCMWNCSVRAGRELGVEERIRSWAHPGSMLPPPAGVMTGRRATRRLGSGITSSAAKAVLRNRTSRHGAKTIRPQGATTATMEGDLERDAATISAQQTGRTRPSEWLLLSTNRPFPGRCSLTAGMSVVGYVRVSTDEQVDSGAGMEAQRNAIRVACRERGWQLVAVVEDAGYSAKDLKRPGIAEALEMVESGVADALVVARLDRLSRSLLDFAALMDRARRKGWSVAALDLGVDTSTPSGEMLASVMASFAQFERRLIGQRTKEALAVKRAEGVRLGRPRTLTPEVVERVWRMHRRGATLRKIALRLNAEGVPTAHGGACWRASSVSGVIRSVQAERAAGRS
jgi:DNA invertase Pin-like site-specific DNA recombinase